MLNPNVEIKKWFFDTISNLGYGVYDGIAPTDAGKTYIVLDGRTSSQEKGKSGYTNEITIIVDIVTKSANFGYKDSETISNDILTAINSDTQITLAEGWNSSDVYVESIRNLDGLNPLDNVFRTLITYKIIITQTL